MKKETKEIPIDLYNRLRYLGIINFDNMTRNYNVGSSDYAQHLVQPWTIWRDWNLDPWDADIVKRVLRTKVEDNKNPKDCKIEDYRKIIHICKERIRQLIIEKEYEDKGSDSNISE